MEAEESKRHYVPCYGEYWFYEPVYETRGKVEVVGIHRALVAAWQIEDRVCTPVIVSCAITDGDIWLITHDSMVYDPMQDCWFPFTHEKQLIKRLQNNHNTYLSSVSSGQPNK